MLTIVRIRLPNFIADDYTLNLTRHKSFKKLTEKWQKMIEQNEE